MTIAIDTARGALQGLRSLFTGIDDTLDRAVGAAGQIPVIGDKLRGLLVNPANSAGKDLLNLQVTTFALDNILTDLADDTAPITIDTFTEYLTRSLNALVGDASINLGAIAVQAPSPTQLDVQLNLGNLANPLKKSAQIDLAGNLGLGADFINLKSQGKLNLDFGLNFDQLRFGHDSQGFYLLPNENGRKLLSVGVGAALQGTPGAAKFASITGNEQTDFISSLNNLFANGDRVVLSDLEGGAGLQSGSKNVYFVRDRTTSGFKLSRTLNGAVENFTTRLAAGRIRSADTLSISLSNHTGVPTAFPDFLNVPGHAFANNDLVVLSGLVGGQGLSNGSRYFVVNAQSGRFQLSTAPNGPAVNFTSNITGGNVHSVFNVTAGLGPLKFDARDKTITGNDADVSLGVKLTPSSSSDGKLRNVSSVVSSLSPVLTSTLNLDLGLEAQSLSFLPKLSADLKVKAGGTLAPMTGSAATDFITVPNNTFANDDAVILSGLSGGTGLFADPVLPYFVRNKNGDRFQLASTPGGSIVNFTTDIVGGSIEARQRSGAPAKIDLENVGVDLGTFLGGFVKTVVGPVKEVTKIVKPVTDALTQPIEPLVQAKSPVTTLVGIARQGGFIEEADENAINALASVVSVVDSLPVTGNGTIILGNAKNLLSADPTIELFPQPNNPALQSLNAKNSSLAGGGLQFPILTDLRAVLKLLQGQPVDLFTYTLPKLDFSMRPSISFPIANPFGLPLSAKFGGELSAKALVTVGYDTKGLLDLSRDTQANAEKIARYVLDGLYISDNKSGATDLPEVAVKGALTVAGGLDVGWASAYLGGGIDASVDLDLNDPDHDGKFRLSNINLQDLGANFNYAGKLSAFAFLEGHAGPIRGRQELGRVVLVEFANSRNDSSAVRPGEALPTEYILNVGPRASQSGVEIRDSAGLLVQDERVEVVTRPADLSGPDFQDVVVKYTKDAAEFVRIRDRIRGDFGAGDDVLITPEVIRLIRPFHVAMGDGDDVASGSEAPDSLVGGNGNDQLIGFGGSDTLLGGADDDVLLPGNGADRVDGGAGRDKVSYVDRIFSSGVTLNFATGVHGGAAAGDVFISIEQFEGSRSADTITGNATSEAFDGERGNDSISSGLGNDVLVGGAGADTLDGGAGIDTANYAAAEQGVSVSLADGTGQSREQGVLATDRLLNIENVLGSAHNDRLVGSQASNLLNGLGGIDTLTGDLGDDTFIVDNVADDVSDIVLIPRQFNGIQLLPLPRQGGIDTVISTVSWTLGQHLENLVLAGVVAPDQPQAPRPDWERRLSATGTLYRPIVGDLLPDEWSLPANLALFVGTPSVDGTGNELANRITGNNGANRLAGLGGNDTLLGRDGNDSLDGGAGNDSMTGGAGNDVYVVDNSGDVITELAGGGSDRVETALSFTLPAEVESLTLTGSSAVGGRGNALANRIIGNASNNQLSSGAGNDTLSGGLGNDTLSGCGSLVPQLLPPPAGRGEIDELTGGLGNDIFILGSSTPLLGTFPPVNQPSRFYDDGNSTNPGRSDYALITDFTPAQDRLQLIGSASSYFLAASGLSQVSGIGLWLEQGATDELIAVLRSSDPKITLTAANTISSALFL